MNANNFNNIKKLPILTNSDIIFSDNQFKLYVEIDHGMYYHDNNWQYIIIENGLIKERHYYEKCNDAKPILISSLQQKNDKLYHYNNKKLTLITPDDIDSWKRILDFEAFLNYSGYNTVGNPIEYELFVNPNDNTGHKNIRLIQGSIISYNQY